MSSRSSRPRITLKLATSLDGRIALANGQSQWITGEEARAYGHELRAQCDGILVGSGTALADNPSLTCRLPGGAHKSPIRIVLDARLRLPLEANLVVTARQTPTWLMTTEGRDDKRLEKYKAASIKIISCRVGINGGVDPHIVCENLFAEGIKTLLIEGGGMVAASFLQASLVDKIVWIRAPRILGGDSITAIADLGLESLSDAPCFHRTEMFAKGNDLVEILEKKKLS